MSHFAGEEHEYLCTCCGKRGLGRYLAGGWWQYPLGWLVHDGGDRWVCSGACARIIASGERDPARHVSGERPKFDLEAVQAKRSESQ
jgi:hypothetical protein